VRREAIPEVAGGTSRVEHDPEVNEARMGQKFSADPCGQPVEPPPSYGELPSAGVSPLIQGAEDAFRRDLPQLLGERPGQWVAYQGPRQIGFGATKLQLFQDCLNRGLRRDEFLVLSIEPEMGELMFGPGAIGDIVGEPG
jgi:hypothetical protein